MWEKRWEFDANSPEGAKKFPLALWMLLGCGVGLIFFIIGIFVLKSSRDVENNWLDAQGTIIEARVERYEDKEHSNYYRGVVNYEYQIGADKFPGVHLTAGSSSPALAESWLAGYKVGDKIAIKVNPQYKYQSKSLEEADDWVGNYLMLFLGLVVFLSFGGGGMHMWRKRKQGDLSIKQKNENI